MCFPKETTSGTDEKEHVSYPQGASLPSIPLQSIPSASKKSELKDPKHVRQEMSKAGKRMWSEKEWILGPSQSKQAAQVRAGGRGLLAKRATSGSMGLKSVADLEQNTFLKRCPPKKGVEHTETA